MAESTERNTEQEGVQLMNKAQRTVLIHLGLQGETPHPALRRQVGSVAGLRKKGSQPAWLKKHWKDSGVSLAL